MGRAPSRTFPPEARGTELLPIRSLPGDEAVGRCIPPIPLLLLLLLLLKGGCDGNKEYVIDRKDTLSVR